MASTEMRVALFVPCYVDTLAPGVGMATLDVLERAGCEVAYDPKPGCCGQPFATTGAFAEARRLARRFATALERAEAVVCPSASCVATVRHRYGGLLGDPQRAASLAGRTFELGEFLVNQLGKHDVGAVFPHRVALLQSCHGLRELGLGTPSERAPFERTEIGSTERLLRAVDGLELVSPDRPDECCGFGGAFAVTLPEVSARIGRDRLDRFAEAGAEVVTSTDVSCLLHIDGIRRASGADAPRTLHLAEILAGGAK